MSTHAHDIQKEIRGYIIIGTSLLALTVITVAVSYLHLNITGAIIVALIIATLKALCVYFCTLSRKIFDLRGCLTACSFRITTYLVWESHTSRDKKGKFTFRTNGTPKTARIRSRHQTLPLFLRCARFFSFGSSVWSSQMYFQSRQTGYLFSAIGSLAVGIALIFYSIQFIKKVNAK